MLSYQLRDVIKYLTITLLTGAVHDGPDFLRASCLIAMEKAYGSFEPILDEFRERVEFIMKRGFDAVQVRDNV